MCGRRNNTTMQWREGRASEGDYFLRGEHYDWTTWVGASHRQNKRMSPVQKIVFRREEVGMRRRREQLFSRDRQSRISQMPLKESGPSRSSCHSCPHKPMAFFSLRLTALLGRKLTHVCYAPPWKRRPPLPRFVLHWLAAPHFSFSCLYRGRHS